MLHLVLASKRHDCTKLEAAGTGFLLRMGVGVAILLYCSQVFSQNDFRTVASLVTALINPKLTEHADFTSNRLHSLSFVNNPNFKSNREVENLKY